MLGKRYLDTRISLAEVLDSVKSLALYNEVACDELDSEETKAYLKSPFRIVVVGDSESGKTSFLSALLGTELPMGNDAPITVFGASRDWGEDGYSCVNYEPTIGLGELEIVDTRGVSKLKEEEREELKRLMTEADYVYYILAAENPWAAKSWDFITEMNDYVKKRCSAILQKVDMLKEGDASVLLGHLSSLSKQRLGYQIKIDCVSAKIGANAWSGSTVKEERDVTSWKSSGYEELENDLDSLLNHGVERRTALQEVSATVRRVLERIESAIREELRTLKSDMYSLKIVESEVENSRDGEVYNARDGLQRMAAVIGEQSNATMKHAAEKNGFLVSLFAIFSRGDGALAVEKKLQESVSDAAYDRALAIARNLLAKCEHQWQIMRDDMQEQMAVSMVDFDSSGFEKNVEKFSENMQQHSKRTMVMLKLSRLLDRLMMSRQRSLKKMLTWVLLLVSGAGILGYVEPPFLAKLPWFLLSVAVVLFLYMMYFGRKTKKALLLVYKERLHNARFEFTEMMEEPYSREIRAFYDGYTSMFENLRNYIVDSELRLEPIHDKWHDVFLRYEAVDQEI